MRGEGGMPCCWRKVSSRRRGVTASPGLSAWAAVDIDVLVTGGVWRRDGGRAEVFCVGLRDLLNLNAQTLNWFLQLRAPPQATPVALLRQATSVARINDARVLTTASGREKSIHQWEELRMFDPGD